MSNNNSFDGKLKKVLASICSFVVGASGVSQAKFNVKDDISNVFYGDKRYSYNNVGGGWIHCDNGDNGDKVEKKIVTGGNPVVFYLGKFKHNDAGLESKFIVSRSSYGLRFRLQAKFGNKDYAAFDVVDIPWGDVAILCSYWIDGEGNLDGENRSNFLDALGKGLDEINGNESYRDSFLFFFNFVFGLVTAEEKKNFGRDDIMEALKYLFRVSTTKGKFAPPDGVKYDDLGNNGFPEDFVLYDYEDLSYCMPKKEAFLTQLVLKLGENRVMSFLRSQVATLNQIKGDAEKHLIAIAGELSNAGFGVTDDPNKTVVNQTGNLVTAYNSLLTEKNKLDSQITTLNNQINDLKKFRYGTFLTGMAIPTVIGGAAFAAYKAGLFGRQGGKVRDIHGRSKRSNHGGNKVTKRSPGGNKVTKKPIRNSGRNKVTKKPMRNSGGKRR